MGLLARGGRLAHLVLGHESASAAHEALAALLPRGAQPPLWRTGLVERLQAYAEGAIDEFTDIELDLGPLSPFRRRVVECLRRVPYAATLTYGELAEWAGRPRAARAVGACMASNPVPIIVPCHRVLAAGGKLGGYSAPQGVAMKQRLLALERNAARGRPRWASHS
jgi:methylated-DNA-[protein]-cysteine S-methyltransferase